MTTGLTVSLAPLETERFGVATAKADLESPDDLPGLLSFCGEHRIHFLIVRCPARAAGTVQALEDGGFRLMDTRLTLETDLLHRPLAPRESTIRPLRAGEASTLESIAREAFAGYPGHFHADPQGRAGEANEAGKLKRNRAEAGHHVCGMGEQLHDRVVGLPRWSCVVSYRNPGELLGAPGQEDVECN